MFRPTVQQLTVQNNILHPLLTWHRKQRSSSITLVEWGSWLCDIKAWGKRKQLRQNEKSLHRDGVEKKIWTDRIIPQKHESRQKADRQEMQAGPYSCRQRGSWGSWNLLKFGLMEFENTPNTWSRTAAWKNNSPVRKTKWQKAKETDRHLSPWHSNTGHW